MASIAPPKKKRLSKAQRRRLKARQARKARTARRQLGHLHDSLPARARQLLGCFAAAFTRPAFLRFTLLVLAAILTLGCRTVSNLLRTLGQLACGHGTTFHRLWSRCRWHAWRLARSLAAAVLDRFLPAGPIYLVGDDTVCEHPGKKVYGKGCHRDPVRSTHSHTAYRWGHKWVVELAQRPVRLGEVGVGIRSAGPHRDRAADQRDGAGVVALLEGDHAEQVQGVGMVGPGGQGLPVQRGRLDEAATLVLVQAKSEVVVHG